MKVKQLEWRQTSLRQIKHNGLPVTTETWVADTALGQYKVYSAISGRRFVLLPDSDSKGLPGFHSGNLIGPPKTPCNSIDHGKSLATEHWESAVGE